MGQRSKFPTSERACKVMSARCVFIRESLIYPFSWRCAYRVVMRRFFNFEDLCMIGHNR